MFNQMPPKLMRRLAAAEGYLELDMPEYALEELAGIADPGDYRPLVDYYTGEALKDQRRYKDALVLLQRAAATMPVAHRKHAITSLVECYRMAGKSEAADLVENLAASLLETAAPAAMQINVVVQFAPADNQAA